jgi:sugar phosphate isomerase/epimerase
VGTGLAGVDNLLGMLKEGGYDGWLSIEYNGNEGRPGLEQSIEFVRNSWGG